MLKRLELSDPNSCMSKARDDEMTFVLLGRDPAAPAAILAWCQERVRVGKNQRGDAQIQEAMECARMMNQPVLPSKDRAPYDPLQEMIAVNWQRHPTPGWWWNTITREVISDEDYDMRAGNGTL